MSYVKYLRSLLLHKWFVFLAGRKVGNIPLWRLIIHDWSKFLPSEFIPYAHCFYGGKSPVDEDKSDLPVDLAWLHHQKFNPHHWQYWILVQDDDPTKLIEIPETYLREMIADWMGAGMAYHGTWDISKWLSKNIYKIQKHMHKDSFQRLCEILEEQGYSFGNVSKLLLLLYN